MGHNIELLRKQEKNSRKPSEDLTKLEITDSLLD